MPTAKELKAVATAILETTPDVTVSHMKKLRRRGTEIMTGACYYGSTYFNQPEVSGNCPSLQLTKRGVTCLLKYERDLFRTWLLGFGDLRILVKKKLTYFLGWNHYSYTFIGDGLVLVGPENRREFMSAVAATTGHKGVWSCAELSRGVEPEWTWKSVRRLTRVEVEAAAAELGATDPAACAASYMAGLREHDRLARGEPSMPEITAAIKEGKL